MEFVLNSSPVKTELSPETIVLDYLRSVAGLKGTKEGCREGDCGACTVLLGQWKDGRVVYRTRVSCLLMLGHLEGSHLVTIEGLGPGENRGENLSGVQRAIVEEGAIQCGFCTPGLVLALTGFALNFESSCLFEDALRSLDGNICRCTGYQSIARAARTVFDALSRRSEVEIADLIELEIVPGYFSGIPGRLSDMASRRPGEIEPRSDEAETIVAGGTDIALASGKDLGASKLRFSLGADSRTIAEDGHGLRIGSAVSFEEFAADETVQNYLPKIKETMETIASTPIRNAATLGGNIVNGSPAADLSVLLLSLEAVLCVGDGQVDRLVPLRDFFTGYKQNVLEKEERIKWVRIPKAQGEYQKNFEKVSKRTHLDIATVNTGLSIRLNGENVEGVVVSAGGVSPYPLVLRQTCDFLEGKSLSEENIRQAVRMAKAEVAPIDDIRGAATYKRMLLGQLIFAHFYEIFGLFPTEVGHV